MIKKLFPDIYIKSIFELPIESLEKKGIKALAFDIDNTVAPFDVAEPDDKSVEFFKNLKKRGFRLILLSNNNKNRITIFNKKLNIIAVSKAGKPSGKKLKKVLEKIGIKPNEAAVIGDQVFTDVLCAHNAGCIGIYSEPMCNRDQLVTKVKRPADKFVMGIYKRRNGI